MSPINHWEASLKREFTRIYKTMFGKGPDHTTVKIVDDMVVMKIEGALTPIEQNLIHTDGGDLLVRQIRDKMVLDQQSDYVKVVEELLCIKVDNLSYTFNSDGQAMYLFMVLHDNVKQNQVS